MIDFHSFLGWRLPTVGQGCTAVVVMRAAPEEQSEALLRVTRGVQDQLRVGGRPARGVQDGLAAARVVAGNRVEYEAENTRVGGAFLSRFRP